MLRLRLCVRRVPCRSISTSSRQQVYQTRNRNLLMYTSAVVRRPLRPPPTLTNFIPGHPRSRCHLCCRPPLSHVLLRNRIRRHSLGRLHIVGAVRSLSSYSAIRCSPHTHSLQRRSSRGPAVEIFPPTEIRRCIAWRIKSGILQGQEREQEGCHRYCDIQRDSRSCRAPNPSP